MLVTVVLGVGMPRHSQAVEMTSEANSLSAAGTWTWRALRSRPSRVTVEIVDIVIVVTCTTTEVVKVAVVTSMVVIVVVGVTIVLQKRQS
jgi:hypothetical protein